MKRIAPFLLIVSFLLACQDSEPTRPPEPGPVSLAIDDGAHNGNTEFFFLPPLVPNPKKNSDFGDSPFNPDLAPFVRICELDGSGPDPSCVEDLTPDLPMAVQPAAEKYKVIWRTKDFGLDPDKFYRIQVFVGGTPNSSGNPGTRLGFRDVDPQSGKKNGSCKDEPFCPFQIGRTISIQVRIEEFALCPDTEPCQTKSFELTDGASFDVEDNRLNIPGQPPDEELDRVTISFGLCTAEEDVAVDNAIDLPTFGTCVKIDILTDEFEGVLDDDATATVSACNLVDPNFGLGSQGEHVRLHAFHGTDGTGAIESLREAFICPALSSLPANPMLRLASRIRDRVVSWIGARPLMASAAVVLGARGGNSLGNLRTLFKFALPAKIDFVDIADAERTAEVSSMLPTEAIVLDIAGNPVAGATVRWNVVQPPDEGAEVEGSVSPLSGTCAAGSPDDVVCTTGATGRVEVDWTLATGSGVNILTAGGRGIADSREAFNGPRGETEVEYELGPFDPFTPIRFDENGGESDDIETAEDEIFETIVENTRLLFTATGVGALVEDQENDPATGTSFGCGASPGSLYQSFTPTQSPLVRVQLRLRAGGGFPAEGVNTSIKIRSGSPTGTELGTATTFVPTAGAQLLVDFDFAPSITVTPGATHVIEWITTGDVILTWLGTIGEPESGGPYSGGTAFNCAGSAVPDNDLNFVTFVPFSE